MSLKLVPIFILSLLISQCKSKPGAGAKSQVKDIQSEDVSGAVLKLGVVPVPKEANPNGNLYQFRLCMQPKDASPDFGDDRDCWNPFVSRDGSGINPAYFAQIPPTADKSAQSALNKKRVLYVLTGVALVGGVAAGGVGLVMLTAAGVGATVIATTYASTVVIGGNLVLGGVVASGAGAGLVYGMRYEGLSWGGAEQQVASQWKEIISPDTVQQVPNVVSFLQSIATELGVDLVQTNNSAIAQSQNGFIACCMCDAFPYRYKDNLRTPVGAITKYMSAIQVGDFETSLCKRMETRDPTQESSLAKSQAEQTHMNYGYAGCERVFVSGKSCVRAPNDKTPYQLWSDNLKDSRGSLVWDAEANGWVSR